MSIIRDITIKARDHYLDTEEILLFIGARQAGKTTILKQLKSVLDGSGRATYFLNLEDPDYLDLLNKSPKNLLKIFNFNLKKKSFVLVDEVQYLKNPSNFLKYFYDEYQGRIKLLVSGSSAFYMDRKFKDSLAGRKRILNVRTLSFREFLRFKHEEDLAMGDFAGLSLSVKERLNLYYLEYITYGGYPRVVLADGEEKVDILQELAYSYIKKDIYEANIRQDEIFYRLFKILAHQAGNLVNSSELASTLGVSKTAIDNYLYIMQKSFHISLVKPFFKNMRKELTKMPKVYFLDLGIRNFFVNNFDSFQIRKDKGVLLENAVFRGLLERYDGNKIRFWRTIHKNEVDFIVDEKQAIEVKASLKQFREKDYKVFSESYPEINLSVVSMAIERPMDSVDVLEPWNV